MDEIYKANPATSPYLTEKIHIKDFMKDFSRKAKELQAKIISSSNEVGPEKLDMNAFADSLDDSGDECPPIEMYDVKELHDIPSKFKKPDFTSEPAKQLARDFACVHYAHQNILTENKSHAVNGRRVVRGQHLKYMGLKWIEDGTGENNAVANETPDLVPFEDYTVTVRVYHPFRHILGSKRPEKPKLCQEIVLLGSQTLADLRDMILCSADMGVPRDMSIDPTAPVTERAWDVYKSGFIFVDNTFYNDFRDPANIDYSAVIRDWAADRLIGPLGVGLIDEARIEDLTVQLGYPYVYQHQGDCEHLLVFSDLKLLGNEPALVSKFYPYVRSIPMQHARFCMPCGKFMAKWVTEDNPRVPVNPCYFCERCFHSYNYIDGVKVGEFRAYPYVDRTALV